jgi:lysozyme
MQIGQQGIALEKHFESIHDGDMSRIGLQPKMDAVDIWTIGWGRALFRNDGKPLKGMKDLPLIHLLFPQYENITMEDAGKFLQEDNKAREAIVNRRLKIPVSQCQFDALVSHVYNTGGSDTLFKLINSYALEQDITSWWESHYITGEGKPLPGLVRRRKSEAWLFSTGELKYYF